MALSVRMELNVYDIAAVILKNHLKPAVARGMRGTAGSGKGVRTLLEHFSMSLCYDYNGPSNHIDFLLTTRPTSTAFERTSISSKYFSVAEQVSVDNSVESTDEVMDKVMDRRAASIDLDIGRLELLSTPIPLPTAIHPLQVGSRAFPGDQPYSVVLSYEDLLFTVGLVRVFMGLSSEGETESSLQDVYMEYKCIVVWKMNREIGTMEGGPR